jgi:hypothetical protein
VLHFLTSSPFPVRERKPGGTVRPIRERTIIPKRNLRTDFRACGRFLVCCSAVITPAAAQPKTHSPQTLMLPTVEGRDLQFRRLPATAGLSQTRVSEFIQDDDGFIALLEDVRTDGIC